MWRSVIGAGFALPRDAGRRPAVQAVPAPFLSRSDPRCRCEHRRSLALRAEDEFARGGAALEEAVGLGGLG